MVIDRSDAERFRPTVHRRDRRWEIHAGKKRFAIVLSEQRSSAPVARFQIIHRSTARRSPQFSPTRWVGAVLAVIASVVTVGIAIQSTGARAGGSYVVSVPVPQRATIPAPAARPIGRIVTRPHHAAVAPNKAAKAVSGVATDALSAVPFDEQGNVSGQGLGNRQAAIAAALRTGSFQQWSANNGDERGFVVAGPAESGCRQLSILVRLFGGDDKVETRRECARDASVGATAAR